VRVEHSIRRLRLHECLTQVDRHRQRGADARPVACAGLVHRQLAARRVQAPPRPAAVSVAPTPPIVALPAAVAATEPIAA
jgi:hypothetical protein